MTPQTRRPITTKPDPTYARTIPGIRFLRCLSLWGPLLAGAILLSDRALAQQRGDWVGGGFPQLLVSCVPSGMTANLRSGAENSAQVVARLHNGARLEVLREMRFPDRWAWYLIRHSPPGRPDLQVEGWMHGSLIVRNCAAPHDPVAAGSRGSVIAGVDLGSGQVQTAVTLQPVSDWVEREVCTSNGDTLNLRQGPGTSHGILAALENGTPLQVLAGNLASDEGWLKVQLADPAQVHHLRRQIEGYVAARFMTRRQCNTPHDPRIARSQGSRLGDRDLTLGAWSPDHDLHVINPSHPQSVRVMAVADPAFAAYLSAEGISSDPYPDEGQDEVAGTAGGNDTRAIPAGVVAGFDQVAAQSALPASEVAARLRAALEARTRAAPDGGLRLRAVAGEIQRPQAVDGHFAGALRQSNGRHTIVSAARGKGFSPLEETHPTGDLPLGSFALLAGGSILRADMDDRDSILTHFDAMGRVIRTLDALSGKFNPSVYRSGDGRAIVTTRTAAGDLDLYLYDGAQLEYQTTSRGGVPGVVNLNVYMPSRAAEQGYLVLERRQQVAPRIAWEYYVLVNGRLELVHTRSFSDTIGSSPFLIEAARGPWLLASEPRSDGTLFMISPRGVAKLPATARRDKTWGLALSESGKMAWIEEARAVVIAANTGEVEERNVHDKGYIPSYPFFIGETVVVNVDKDWFIAAKGVLDRVGRAPEGVVKEVGRDFVVIRPFSYGGSYTLEF